MNELEKSMYYGATASAFEKARQLRNQMTKEELMLWERIKGKQVCNVRFRRQHPINTFIADFYCHEAKLVIELDGKIHLQSIEYDIERTKIIENFNIKVIRFENEEVLTKINDVILQITKIVIKRLKHKTLI